MKVVSRRDVILGVRDRWNEVYSDHDDNKVIGGADAETPPKSIVEIRVALAKLNLRTCSEDDIANAIGYAIGTRFWTCNFCSECGDDHEELLQFGESTDSESSGSAICGQCLSKATKLLTSHNQEG